jgi:hypothetical protein
LVTAPHRESHTSTIYSILGTTVCAVREVLCPDRIYVIAGIGAVIVAIDSEINTFLRGDYLMVGSWTAS